MGSLPSGYTQFEYIESNGTQYIDPDVSYTKDSVFNLKVEADIAIVDTTVSNWRVSGSGNVTNQTTVFYFGIRGDGNIWGYGAGTQDLSTGITSDNNRHIFTLDGESGTYTISDTAVYISGISFASTTANTSKFFISAWSNQSYIATCHSERIYSYKFYFSGTLQKHLIPCKNASGQIGLYDVVGQKFYGNFGSGSFIAGPEIIAPDTPDNFSNATAVTLIWNHVECEGYNIYKDGIFLASTKENYYVDLNVSDGQNIVYSLAAYNGNLESEQVEISVTVKTGYTALIPIISSAFFQ